MTKTNSYIVKTLGCKANLYDSQLIEAELQKRGWKPVTDSDGLAPDLCVVNSCTVTDEADRQSRKMAARLSRDNPGARVVMTGCGAEVDPELMAKSKGVHYVIGNRSKPELVELILKKLAETSTMEPSELGEILGGAKGYEKMLSRHPIDRDWYLEEGFQTPPVEITDRTSHSAKTRAFLKIQEGCNAFCTYCIIPYGRGPSRSIKPGEVIRQIRELVAQGVREVVITGTNIGDYGTDWAPESSVMSEQLVLLFEMIFAETTLERLRVSSLDPVEITPDLLALMEREPRFCPHFHVSLQSSHSRILKLMKRKYDASHVRSCLESIAALGAALDTQRGTVGGAFVGMDVITGFPGETDEEFEEGYAALKALPWSRLHVFPYSERNGTPATRLPDSLPQEKRVKRARRLQALSLERMKTLSQKLLDQDRHGHFAGTSVLLELKRGEWMSGYSSNYLRVQVPALDAEGLENTVVRVGLTTLVIDEAGADVAFQGQIVSAD